MLLLAGCVSGEPAVPQPSAPPSAPTVAEARLLPDNLPPDLVAGSGGPDDRSDLDRLCEPGRRIARETEDIVLSVEVLGEVAVAGPLVLFDPLAPQQHAELGSVPAGRPVAALCRARATPRSGGEAVDKAVGLRLQWSDVPVVAWAPLGALLTWEGRAALADAAAWKRAEDQDEAAQRRFEAATDAGRTTWGLEDDPVLHPETDVSEVGRRRWAADPQAGLLAASVPEGAVDVAGGPTGFGAGTFHAYAGRDASDAVVQVVVDFRVLLDPIEVSVDLPIAGASAGAADPGALAGLGLQLELASPGQTSPRRAERPLWFTLREDPERPAHPSRADPRMMGLDAEGTEVPLHVQGHGGVWWVQRPDPPPPTLRIARVVGVRAL